MSIETCDDGHSRAARAKTENRPEVSRLENDIRSGQINVMLVIELSRLSRGDTIQDYVAWLTLCADHGAKLAMLSHILDPSQNSDWMLLLMESEFYSMKIRVLTDLMVEG